jgi:hypothetical protein
MLLARRGLIRALGASSKPMSQLINCNKCGRQVSSYAEKCPHCQDDPHYYPPTLCFFCKQPVNDSQTTDVLRSRKVHSRCLNSFKNTPELVQFSCPACKKKYRYESFSKGDAVCLQCGHPFHFSECSLCRGLVLGGSGYTYSGFDEASMSPWVDSCHHGCNKLSGKLSPANWDCFIATACYGSAFSPELIYLRQFRDEILRSSNLGSRLVDVYCLISPPVANSIRRHMVLRGLVKRILLSPILWFIEIMYGKVLRKE